MEKKKSLAETYPELAKEWHPTRNESLRPENVTAGSSKKAWWLLPYDVPEDYPVEHLRGKHFDFEWEARINHRANGAGCPYLSGQAVLKGFNDLTTTHPELAKEWHPTKNGNLKPEDVTTGSGKKVWWFLPYDDPETGKHFDFEWETGIAKRLYKSKGCPFLSGRAVWPGFNDLATTHPELAKEWHPTRNGNLTPEEITPRSHVKAWWYLSYDDPETGKHFDFEWSATVGSRVSGNGCPYLSGRSAWPGFNDLATTHPALAREWHPTKNGDLKPEDVTAGGVTKVWWFLPYDDPKTGKHFDFEWKAPVCDRTIQKNGCPYLSGRNAWPGFNDLATVHPALAREWHPTKNGDLKPEDVTAGCNRKVWWLLPYDDPATGKHFDFEWEASISNRVHGKKSCPYLSGQAVWPGFNDLATVHPDLAREWHPTKNGDLKPEDVTAGCSRKVWWLLPYDDPATGKHFDFEWEAIIAGRAKGNGCPYLSGDAVWPGFNDLATVRPDLAQEWHPTKNGNLKPEDVSAGSGKNVWWYLSYDDPKTGDHSDYEWRATIGTRTYRDTGCPYLSESYGEQHIMKYLSHHHVEAKYEKSFPNLKGVGGRSLTYDFHITGTSVLIEFHGQQHYKSVSLFGGDKPLEKQKEHDRRKREYAKKNGYKLIEISYKYNTYEKVAAYLDEHLLPLLTQNLPASA